MVIRLDLQHQGHIPAAICKLPSGFIPVDMTVKGQHMHIVITHIFVIAQVGGNQPVTPHGHIPHAGGEGILMGGIQAKDLSFGYDRDRIFENATFFLPKNTFGVVAGQSGIGKSTLLKLLLGVLRPESGDLVFRNGGAETPVDATTRSLFAYVPQGNLLLSGTIRENLCITRPDATEEEIDRAVFISGMDAFLPGLPQGLDTVLGESGAGLSEGQAQRLSIARAVLSQAPILLLDEATSALDAETEKLVLQRIKTLPNTTCIAVTHKQAPMDCCDWILEVGEGSYSLKEKR